MLKSFFYIESSHFDATASQLSCGLCNLGVLRDFEDEEFPPVNVDDLKSPTRKCKKLVKTSQTATRKVLQASYVADSSWSDDLLPNERDEVYPTSLSARGSPKFTIPLASFFCSSSSVMALRLSINTYDRPVETS